jgi:hypothetical protein
MLMHIYGRLWRIKISHISSTQLENERNNLIKCWEKIKLNIEAINDKKWQKDLFGIATLARELSMGNNKVGDKIRTFHNKFGLKTHKLKFNDPLNKCSGAFYRTSMFINLTADQRGFLDKKFKKTHIEHTIPVKIFKEQLIKNKDIYCYPKTLFDWLLSNSIGTAFHNSQEKYGLIRDGFQQQSNVFNSHHLDFNMPFKRYLPQESGGEIWDVWNKKLIDPNNFTLNDHKNNIKSIINHLKINRLNNIFED